MSISAINTGDYLILPPQMYGSNIVRIRRIFVPADRSISASDEASRNEKSPEDKITISDDAKKIYQQHQPLESKLKSVNSQTELTEEEKKEVEKLEETDAKVRQHEEAHKRTAGTYAGPISYKYKTGPDGKKYAVGGHVPIDTSAGDTPEETLRKTETVQRAALAPAEPSPADQKIAAQAQQMATEARKELAEEQSQENKGNSKEAQNDITSLASLAEASAQVRFQVIA